MSRFHCVSRVNIVALTHFSIVVLTFTHSLPDISTGFRFTQHSKFTH